jgi:non-ribosomal peptide synthetase component F/methionyl-tRNA formyltransferase
MGAESRFTCGLIGQKSLLILCAEDLLARGHVIRGVATESDEIRRWAAGRGVPTVSTSHDSLVKLFSDEPCDYLFSIINHRVLSEDILRLPTRGAINFHDGTLPGYAGMYVTTWAIVNGEREHGISWHWMTKEIDAGGVLQGPRFPVASDETAFTLNTKCYEAGFESFCRLLSDLEQGTAPCRPQTGEVQGGYYALRKRPEGLGTLDWSRPAAELDALFRSVDFGRYKNPIGCTKVVWGDRVLVPGQLTVLKQKSNRPAGTWAHRAETKTVLVHTSTNIVELGGFRTLDGASVETDSLPPLSRLEERPPAELDQLLERVCVHESFWAKRLAAREAVTLPYVPEGTPRHQSPTQHNRRDVDGRPLVADGDSAKFVARAVAALSLYVGRLSGKAAFDIDFQGAAFAALPREAARYFATSVPLKTRLDWTGTVAEHVGSVAKAIAEVEKRETYPRDVVLRYPQISEDHRQKLREVADVAVVIRPDSTTDKFELPAHELPQAQLAFVISPAASTIELVANADVFDERLLAKVAAEFAHVVAQIGTDPNQRVGDVDIVAPSEQAQLARWNDETRIDYQPLSIPQMFEAQVALTPDATAVVFRGEPLSYRQLDERANQLANLMIAGGVQRGDLVGVLMDRSTEMVVSLYAVLKTGAAYVPMDPAYPGHRLAIMVEDAHPAVILTETSRVEQIQAMNVQAIVVDRPDTFAGLSTTAPAVAIEADDVAYLIYTSGSTGRPKGAKVTHGNIQNFFLTLDQKLAGDPPATWLGMTSISFDISIPELFWTLTRGGRVILRGSPKADQPAATAAENQNEPNKNEQRKIDFSLFFRKVVHREESAQSESRRLSREASRFASQHGFAIRPEGHADDADDNSTTSQPLTSCVKVDDHPEAFQVAAQIGAHILTRLLGQPEEKLAKNIALYQRTWQEAGHAHAPRVTLLVPTFVSANDKLIKGAIRTPMKEYLKKELTLVREAAWDFPPFQKASEDEGQTLDHFLSTLSEAGLDELLDFAFDRYYATCGLFGTLAHCRTTVERLKQIGVDEIACLVDFGSLDFGLTADQILEHLPLLNELKVAANAEQADEDPDDIATLIERHGLTHLSCTPSRAASLTWDPRTRQALGRLKLMIVGGEALPEELTRQLQSIVPGRVFNVYGPTETTVWSTMHELTTIDGPVPLGKPIANTQLYVVDERRRRLPVGVPGELLIGGDGVGRGYLNRPELTEARFLKTEHGTLYRTGDLVQLRADGAVEFLGRLDDQVKIRGHRIELGEIESVLELHPSVRKAVVHPQDDAAGGKRLVAYVVPQATGTFGVEALQAFAKERLPEFMVPSHFESLNDLPLTPSGKVDRRALPKPNFGQRRDGAARTQSPPRTNTERRLVELWQKLLDVAGVDRGDNFFELGGHSLLGMRAISQIQEIFGVRLSAKTFLVSSLAQVGAEIDRLSAEHPATADEEPSSKSAGGLRRFPQWFLSKVGAAKPGKDRP